MAISTAAQLTEQFYNWERRGRGWHKAENACDLEPPFAPFFEHFLPEGPIIDDGKRPSLFQSLFGTPPSATIQPTKQEEEPSAFPYTDDTPLTVFSIAIPRNGRAHAEHMEQLLVMLSYRNRPMSFELIGTGEVITVQLVCRDVDSNYIQTQVKAYFPDFGIQETCDDYIEDWLRADTCVYTIDFGLAEECMRPMAQLSGDKECLIPLFGIFNNLQGDECVVVQTLFCGLRNPWAQHMLNSVYDNDGKSSFFFDEPEMVKFAHDKVSRPLCAATIRVMTFAETMEESSTLLDHVATAIMHGAKSSSNALITLIDGAYTVHERLADILLRESHRVGMLINSRELATLAHFPLVPLRKAAQQRNTVAVPHGLIGHDYCIGLNVHQGVESEITLSDEQRVRHMHLIGATGTGKSTLLHSLMMQDTLLGNGFMCLDPHGDLIDMLLDTIPEGRIEDVVLIDPSDTEHPIGFNILSAHSELEKELLASDLVALFRRFSISWGDQMNSVFANAILAFLYNTKGGTLADLRRFLIETVFRNHILSTVTDPDITYYWQHEYPLLKSSSIGSILTRLDSFLRPRVIRNMVCQRTCLDFAELMDSRKIILVKLSQGLLGAENSFLLGAFMVSKLQQIAMSRQAQAKHARIPFYCYIDEFHQFTTPSMNEILSGARKYGLGLILAHQDMQQVQKYDGDIANSLLSNAGTRICFRLGDIDAKRLQEGFASFSAEDLQNLAIGDAIVRVNTASTDCSLTVIPYKSYDDSFKEDIIAYSRDRYSYGIPTIETLSRPESPPSPPTRPRSAPPVSSAEHVAPVPPRAVLDEPPQERTAREHVYLQTLIKQLAEQAGYTAQLELRTPDSKGQVDVLLEKDGRRIAVEVSVSTTAEWELHNIQKCVAAGYEQIAVCSTNQSKIQQIQALVHCHLTADEIRKVRIITPDQVQSLFVSTVQPQQDTETTMKGYRVKVKYGEKTGADALMQSIIQASRK